MKMSVVHMLKLCVGVGMLWAGGVSLGFMDVHASNSKPTMRVAGVQSHAGKELVTLQFSAPVRYQHAFLLHKPERVVVDLDAVEAAGIGLPADYNGGLMHGMRFAQHSATTSRIVIDLTEPAKTVSVHEFDRDARDSMKMVVDIVLSDEAVSSSAQQPARSIIHDARPKPPSAYIGSDEQPQQLAYTQANTQARVQEHDVKSDEAQPIVTMSPKTSMFVRNKQTSKPSDNQEVQRPPVVQFGIVPPSDVASSSISVTPYEEPSHDDKSSAVKKVPLDSTLDNKRSDLNDSEKNNNIVKGESKKATKDFKKPKEAHAINVRKEDGQADSSDVLASQDNQADISASVPVKKKNGKPIIIIDAGHGGKDPGASTADGDVEKMITLSYAKKLAEALNKSGKYQARLTRSTDIFILLGERVNIARRVGADMFISLHADSAPASNAQGLSIYTLSETSSDKETAALAEQENNSDSIGGMNLSGQKEEVADILIDLARRETKNKSMYLAEGIVVRMKEQGVQTLRDTHRFAGFKVLKAPDIPSVLVELGFLSTPSEAERLKTNDYRSRVVRGLVAGIDSYFGK